MGTGRSWWAGDFNVMPTDLDVWDPGAFVGSTHVTDEERRRLDAILQRGRLVDAYRLLHPGEPGFTYWDYRAGRFHKHQGLRIDFALVAEELTGHVERCGIDRQFRKKSPAGHKPSDHAPLLVDFAV